MKYTFITVALVATFAGTALGAVEFIAGNYYGKAVERISYTDWGLPGTYKQVIDMSDGQCVFENVSYSGGMAPLNEEVSLHFRGPMHLKQFAFYSPGSSTSTQDLKSRTGQRRRAHRHQHRKREWQDWVTATINGDVVSWPLADQLGAQKSPATGTPQVDAENAALPTPSSSKSRATAPPTSLSSEPNATAPPVNVDGGIWGRQAYYNAETGQADGLVFLANYGGQKSGVFDPIWGNSLSYASKDATAGASSPQVLSDVLLRDNNETIIYSDRICEGNDCGFYRPGTVAHHGFGGESKMFLMEFSMPLSGKTNFANADMPAVWMLNAAIPRTQQYGRCSCWPGCGEFDIFEVLDSGNIRAKSTVHTQISGGVTDYFERPTTKTRKAAVIFDKFSSAAQVTWLDDDVEFSATMANNAVVKFEDTSKPYELSKEFKLGA